jgi:hypothetical protein
MEFELTSAKRSSDEQHCTIELGMDSNSSERQSASDDNQSPENSDKASESGYVFFLFFLTLYNIYFTWDLSLLGKYLIHATNGTKYLCWLLLYSLFWR